MNRQLEANLVLLIIMSSMAVGMLLLIFFRARRNGRMEKEALLLEVSRAIEKIRAESDLIPLASYQVVHISSPILGNDWVVTVKLGSTALAFLNFSRLGKSQFVFQAMEISKKD